MINQILKNPVKVKKVT
jgi:calmodulin